MIIFSGMRLWFIFTSTHHMGKSFLTTKIFSVHSQCLHCSIWHLKGLHPTRLFLCDLLLVGSGSACACVHVLVSYVLIVYPTAPHSVTSHLLLLKSGQ